MSIFFYYLQVDKPESYLALQEGKETANPFFELDFANFKETEKDKKH